jgi:hypothetical protein
MTGAARTLTEALRRVWTLEAAERQAVPHAAALAAVRTGGPVTPVDGAALPAAPLVKGRLAALGRAWTACPDAETVYQAAKAAWHQQSGRCPGCGAEACVCDSAPRADSPGAAASESPAMSRCRSKPIHLEALQCGDRVTC